MLNGEGAGPALVNVTFLSSQRMRALHRRTLGSDRSTDVISFGLSHDGLIVGDIYICPPVARRVARDAGIPASEEILRLVVHGVLHVLGYDHPPGGLEERSRSRMWHRQEHYLADLR